MSRPRQRVCRAYNLFGARRRDALRPSLDPVRVYPANDARRQWVISSRSLVLTALLVAACPNKNGGHKLDLGMACAQDDDCVSSHCADAVCCSSACAQPRSCDGDVARPAAHCSAAGACTEPGITPCAPYRCSHNKPIHARSPDWWRKWNHFFHCEWRK